MLRLTVFNVGQASSVLIDFGRGRLGVIDCGAGVSGKNPLAEELAGRLRREPATSIIFLLLTHLDWDHINGFVDLAENITIRNKIRRIFCDSTEFRSLWEVVTSFLRGRDRAGLEKNVTTSRNIRSFGFINKIISSPPPGVGLDFHGSLISPQPANPEEYPVRLRLSELSDDFVLLLLSPSQALRDRAAQGIRASLQEDRLASDLLKSIGGSRPDWNAASTVLVIEHGGARVLLSGDANSLTWSEIFSRGGDRYLNSDVAVAWHHGARLGSRKGENYDEKVWSSVLRREVGKSPCVLISHGCGHYGHPHEDTIRSIKNYGGTVACTQLRERSPISAADYSRAINFLGLNVFPNLAEGWDIYSEDVNACSGNIVADIGETGSVSIACEGPRQFGGPSRPPCCLFPPAKSE
jgi:beta-lactamase superfamily II metal-dependent hydrolase